MKKGLGVLLCMVTVLLITSCSEKRDYRMALPADAGVVLGIDFKSLAEKAGMNGEAEQAELEAFLKEKLDASMSSYAMELVKNPGESGLDLSMPAYFYYEASGEMGFLVKVSDEEKVETLLEKLNEGSALESKNGMNTLSLDTQSGIVFNESALLLLVNPKASSSPLERGITLLKQKEAQSFMSNKELFKAYEALDGDMTALVSYGAVMPAQLTPMLKNVMPENVQLSDINLLLSINFEKGKITMKGGGFYLSDVAKAWAKKGEGVVIPQKGLFLPQESPVFWMGLGLKGEKLFDLLMEYPQYATQMKPMEPVLRKLFAAIEGDVAISMPSMQPNAMSLDVNIELKKGEEHAFMATMIELLQGLGAPLASTDSNAYSLSLPGLNLAFGLDAENHFYLTVKNANVASTDMAPAGWTKEVEGNLVYYRFDINMLAGMLAPMADNQRIQYLNMFDFICTKTKNVSSVELEVVMKNQDENILKQVVDIVKLLNE